MGDFTLRVYHQVRNDWLDFLDFVANVMGQESSRPRNASSRMVTLADIDSQWGSSVLELAYPGPFMDTIQTPSPVGALWQLSCFGYHTWYGSQVVWERQPEATRGRKPPRTSAQLHVDLPPELRADEIQEIRDTTLAKLASVEGSVAAKDEWEAFIREDFEALTELCAASGDYGRAVFPQLANPFERAVQMMVPLVDGNTRDLFLETELAWLAIFFETS